MRPIPTLVVSVLLPLLASLPGIAAAQDSVVIYRCTDASGALTVQNDVPCPEGSEQQKSVMETAAPASVTSAPAAPPAPIGRIGSPALTPLVPAAPIPSEPQPPAAIADSERLPPPALYECRTWDKDRYLSETATPPRRCVPLQTTGLAGNPAMGAGVACQMTTDQCQRVADGDLCRQWRQRLREAEAAVRFGRADNRVEAQSEVERIGRIVQESTCGR